MAKVRILRNLIDLISRDVVRIDNNRLPKSIKAVDQIAAHVVEVVVREILLGALDLDDHRILNNLLSFIIKHALVVRHAIPMQDVDEDLRRVLDEARVDHRVRQPVDRPRALVNEQRRIEVDPAVFAVLVEHNCIELT